MTRIEELLDLKRKLDFVDDLDPKRENQELQKVRNRLIKRIIGGHDQN